MAIFHKILFFFLHIIFINLQKYFPSDSNRNIIRVNSNIVYSDCLLRFSVVLFNSELLNVFICFEYSAFYVHYKLLNFDLQFYF